MAGIFLLVMSVSGSILVFHHEIDHAFFADRFIMEEPAEGLSFDNSFEKVRTTHPGWEIRVPAFPEPGESLRYELRKNNVRKWVFVHPQRGDILGVVDRADRRLVDLLLTVHYSFFAGTLGKLFVALLGVVFLVLLITGIIIYRKSLVKVLLFRQHFSVKSKRALFSSLHRWVGVWGLMLNMFICITGIRMAYVVASGAMKAVPFEISVPAMTQSIDAMIAGARTRHPDFEVTYLRFPTNESGKLSLLGRHVSDPDYYGSFYSSIMVNWNSGEVEAITSLKDKPWMDRFLIILQPLHLVDFGGMAVKVIYSIAGVLPGLLAISGFVIWRYRKRVQQKRTSKKLTPMTV